MTEQEAQGAEPSAAEPQPDPAVAGVQPVVSAEAEDEFTARVRQGGDFAVKQVKDAQRELSRKTQKLGPLEPIVDAVGGAQALQQHLARLSGIVSNKRLLEIVEHFEKTGELPAGLKTNGAAPETQTEFQEPWTPDIDPVKQEVSTLRAELNGLRAERGVEKVQGFFGQFFKDWPVDDEGKQKVAIGMKNLASAWASNPQGIKTLNDMNYETFSSLALKTLTKDELKASLKRELLSEEERKRAERTATATDVPARGTTGKERTNKLSPVEAYRQICRELGVSPDQPLLR